MHVAVADDKCGHATACCLLWLSNSYLRIGLFFVFVTLHDILCRRDFLKWELIYSSLTCTAIPCTRKRAKGITLVFKISLLQQCTFYSYANAFWLSARELVYIWRHLSHCWKHFVSVSNVSRCRKEHRWSEHWRSCGHICKNVQNADEAALSPDALCISEFSFDKCNWTAECGRLVDGGSANGS